MSCPVEFQRWLDIHGAAYVKEFWTMPPENHGPFELWLLRKSHQHILDLEKHIAALNELVIETLEG